MIGIRGKTEGLDDFEVDAEKETKKIMRSVVGKAGTKVKKAMVRKLRRPGPSAPGEPPGEAQGWLWKAIGRSKVRTKGNSVACWVGVGEGAGLDWVHKARGVLKKKQDPYHYWRVHEFGGTWGKRRYPPRSFVRTTFREQEPGVARDWEDAL